MTSLPPARVRFAPSPTGHTHLGSARTALYNMLLARQTGGQFILRIEDTDRKRYVPGAEEELKASLRWLGLQWDEGIDVGGPHAPYRQSERSELYQQAAQQLVNMGKAYPCFCTSERLEQVRQQQIALKIASHYDGTCRTLDPDEAIARVARGERHVIRFRMPKTGSIVAHDYLRGAIEFENSTLDDSILVKSDGLALYHLAAMVDDHIMDITHVIRGSEWLPSFPLHTHIYQAFEWQQPEWVHLSLFLKPSGKGKMSKRDTAAFKEGGHSIFVNELRELGYIPEGVINWIALMGWSYDAHTEFFTLPDLVEKFSIDRLNPSPAAINFTKLDHFNGLHIRNLPVEDLAQRLKPFFVDAGYQVDDEKLLKVTRIIQIRIVTLDEAIPMAGFFFQDEVHPEPAELIGKGLSAAESTQVARRALAILEDLPELNPETAEEPLRLLAEELGLKVGVLFGILRSTVTGQSVSPPLFESMEIIGRVKVLQRVRQAIEVLENSA